MSKRTPFQQQLYDALNQVGAIDVSNNQPADGVHKAAAVELIQEAMVTAKQMEARVVSTRVHHLICYLDQLQKLPMSYAAPRFDMILDAIEEELGIRIKGKAREEIEYLCTREECGHQFTRIDYRMDGIACPLPECGCTAVPASFLRMKMEEALARGERHQGEA